MRISLLYLFLSLATASAPLLADHHAKTTPPEDEKEESKESPAKKDDKKETEPKTTEGKFKLRSGETMEYEVEAGEIQLRKSDGQPSAKVFYVAYTAGRDADGKADPNRPLMFCFNGGPGSCAVWLHLGGLSPKRIGIPGKGTIHPEPPYQLKDNPDSILSHADLVFVDPVSTGYSRPEEEKNARDFHGINEDVESVAEFIRLYITRNARWSSPKYLLGESYGAIRTCGLADHLQDKHGMYLNGICLLSGLIDFQTIRDPGGNDLPYITFLPAMAATARYHGQANVGRNPEEVREEVTAFANGPYARALLLGERLSEKERKSIAEKISKYTSVPLEKVIESDLRVSTSVFRKEVLRKESQVIGRFDGRVKGPALEPLYPTPRIDPSYDNVYGAFASAINSYLRDDLGYKAEHDRPYEILTGKVHPWNYKPFEGRYVTVAPRLHGAMIRNPHLKVLVLCGHYDLATPAAGIEHTISQLDLPKSRREMVEFEYYEGGHMMYTNPQAMKKLGEDLREWIGDSPAPKKEANPKSPKESPTPEEEKKKKLPSDA